VRGERREVRSKKREVRVLECRNAERGTPNAFSFAPTRTGIFLPRQGRLLTSYFSLPRPRPPAYIVTSSFVSMPFTIRQILRLFTFCNSIGNNSCGSP
jgi:hypothetical protein